MPFALLFLYLVASVGTNSFAKLTSSELKHAARAKYLLYITLNGILACLFFWMFGGFAISVNTVTLIYALIYAAIVAGSLIVTPLAYNLMSVSGVGIIRSGFGLICTVAVGALLFSEKITPIVILRIVLTLVSVILVMLESKKGETPRETPEGGGKIKARGVLLVLVLVLNVAVICANTLTLKYFTLDTRTTDENSFFFFTNVFLVAGCAILLAVESIRDREGARNALSIFKPRAMIGITGNTVSANLGTLFSTWIIVGMDISVYTPVMSSIGIIAGFIGSIIYREKLRALSYVSIIFALCAVII
jgi:drug/metabolite transporter (DMT)-like permease